MLVSARSANLRAILADDEEVRQTVLEMVTTMESIDREEMRGFRLANQLDPNLPEFMTNSNPESLLLETEPYNLIHELISRTHPNQALSLPREAHFVEEVALRGVRYATARSSKYRGSRILYQNLGTTTHDAGTIQDIFEYSYRCAGEERKTFFISVRNYVRYNRDLDPYPKFGFAGGFLCETTPIQLHILQLSQVVSHFGLTRMTGKYAGYVHVMPLDKVSNTYPFKILLVTNTQTKLMLSFKLDKEVGQDGSKE